MNDKNIEEKARRLLALIPILSLCLFNPEFISPSIQVRKGFVRLFI